MTKFSKKLILIGCIFVGGIILQGCNQNRYQTAEWRTSPTDETAMTNVGTSLPGTSLPRLRGTTLPGSTLPGTSLPGSTLPQTFRFPGTTMPNRY